MRMKTTSISDEPEGFRATHVECPQCGHSETKMLAFDPLQTGAVRWLSSELQPPNKVARAAQFPKFTFVHLAGTKFQTVAFGAGRRAYRGNIGVKQGLFRESGGVLLKFAKETTNPQLAAVLIEKAADLNLKLTSRVRRRTRLLKRRMSTRKVVAGRPQLAH